MKRIFVYPGTFDPVTLGHMDIIERASRQCDELVVAVLINDAKKTVFTIEERVDLLKITVAHMPNVKVESFEGLLADYMRGQKTNTVVRGLRAVSDFDYELQIALLNKNLYPEIETLFMIANLEYLYLSSSVVRDLAKNHADLSSYVPRAIVEKVAEKYKT